MNIVFFQFNNIGLLRKLCLLLVVCCILSACHSAASRISTAKTIAQEAGMKSVTIDSHPFLLRAYTRFSKASSPITVYIEGDGMAWVSRNRPSLDPTPIYPTTLALAALDSAPSVAYIARPCQYIALERNAECTQDYWLQKRFAPEVINSINGAISFLVSKSGASGVHLVGYSGGGAVAALIAAQRDDILSLRTVAGYLDHVALNRSKKVSPLTGSLDPMQISAQLENLPQIHYVGSKDEVIPSWVAKGFIKPQNQHCSEVTVIQNASHEKGWEAIWKDRAGVMATCKQ